MGAARHAAFVDSGAWIALFRARDDHHREAEQLFRQAIASRVSLLTTNLILAEVHRFVLHHAGIRAAATAVERIDASRHVRIVFATAAHHAAARGWLERFADQRLTYTDTISFAVMERKKSARR